MYPENTGSYIFIVLMLALFYGDPDLHDAIVKLVLSWAK